MDKFYVTATVTAKSGAADTLKALILANMPAVRAEDGCIRYDLLANREKPDTFVFYEIWRDGAALKAHAQSPHMQSYFEKAAPLQACPTDVQVWQGVDVR